jgi:FtsZ-interacting cell division protein ZipA
MDSGVLITLVVVAVLVLVVVVLLVGRRRRSAELRERFGDEYQRTVQERGSRREAEAELAERQRRRTHLDIRPLEPAARERYAEAWRRTQASFVDSPASATREADLLVSQVMRDRG